MNLRGLSILQPWASLFATGQKRIETRSWATPYRGEVVILAGKRWEEEQARIANGSTFFRALRQRPIPAGDPKTLWAELAPGDLHLPLGAAIARAELVDCKPVEDIGISKLPRQEIEFGDYSPGRFGWIFRNLRRLEGPVAMRGAQGLFPLQQSPAAFLRLLEPAATCRECTCVEQSACDGGCYWVEPDLCSACKAKALGTA